MSRKLVYVNHKTSTDSVFKIISALLVFHTCQQSAVNTQLMYSIHDWEAKPNDMKIPLLDSHFSLVRFPVVPKHLKTSSISGIFVIQSTTTCFKEFF